MFSKIFTSSAVVLALAFQVNAHAAVMPVMGVANPVRNDVKRPNAASPCGRGVDIAAGMNSAQVATADANGQFSGTIVNFNKRLDGSRKMTAQVDPTGTGQNFVTMTITQNGQLSPPELGTEPLTAQLPAGMKCTGGTTGDKCLVQFKNTVGFGACMVVQQGGTVAATSASAGAPASTPSPSPAPENTAPKAGGVKGFLGKLRNRELESRAVGTRAARVLRALMEELKRAEDDYSEDGLVDDGFFDGDD